MLGLLVRFDCSPPLLDCCNYDSSADSYLQQDVELRINKRIKMRKLISSL